jgi:Tol biopolymer transport system component
MSSAQETHVMKWFRSVLIAALIALGSGFGFSSQAQANPYWFGLSENSYIGQAQFGYGFLSATGIRFQSGSWPFAAALPLNPTYAGNQTHMQWNARPGSYITAFDYYALRWDPSTYMGQLVDTDSGYSWFEADENMSLGAYRWYRHDFAAIGHYPTWVRHFMNQTITRVQNKRTYDFENIGVWMTDYEPPSVQLLDLHPNRPDVATNGWYNASTPSFHIGWSVDDNFEDRGSVQTHTIALGGRTFLQGNWGACPACALDPAIPADEPDGYRDVYIYADQLGGPRGGGYTNSGVYVDRTAPFAKVSAVAADDSGTRYKVQITDKSDAMSGITGNWSLRYPNGVEVANQGSPATVLSNIDLSAWDGQNVQFSIALTDNAGNIGTYSSNTLNVRSRAGATFPVSATAAGTLVGGNAASVSSDGRFMAFVSGDTALDAADTNGFSDVFVLDRQLGTAQRVSVSTAGASANGNSSNPVISGDGRYVAFASAASNLLISGDSNNAHDVFVRDLTQNTTTRVNLTSGGLEAIGTSAVGNIAISNDGRYIAFESDATNLVANDTNAVTDVFVRDRNASPATTERVSVGPADAQSPAGVQATGRSSGQLAISADGRFVVFESDATNLVAGDTNLQRDVFRRDRNALPPVTERVSVRTGGVEATGGVSTQPGISTDGRYVVFSSTATNLDSSVPDTNARADIFVRDLAAPASTTRVSYKNGSVQAGDAGTFGSTHPSISADGRFVAFSSRTS